MAALSLQVPCSTGMGDCKEWKDSKVKASKERQMKARQKGNDTQKQPAGEKMWELMQKPIEAINYWSN